MLQQLDKDGYRIVIFSNQAQIKTALTGKAATNMKAKIDAVLKAVGIQAAAFVSTIKADDDPYRKPKTGMWEFFCSECNGGVDVDKRTSFYAGDAAGRPQDFSDSDKEFAKAIGLEFKTPEDMFGASAGQRVPRIACTSMVARLLTMLCLPILATAQGRH